MIPRLLLLFVAGGTRPEVTVTLRMEARVRGTEVEVGEIARVEGLDPASVARVAELELGSAPAPGYSRLFLAENVRGELERRLDGLAVRVGGERACRVYPEVEALPAAEIQEAARAELARVFAGHEARLELRNEIPRVEIPVGAEGRSVRAQPITVPLASGAVSIAVDVLVDGARYRTVWTNWQVDIFESRAVLAQPVRAGQALRPELFAPARVRVQGPGPGELLPPEALLGAVAVRDLAPGDGVTARDVQRPAVLAAGESLFLCVRKGAIEARVGAVALEGGAIGDRIRVRSVNSTQELVATLKSRDLCEIDLGH